MADMPLIMRFCATEPVSDPTPTRVAFDAFVKALTAVAAEEVELHGQDVFDPAHADLLARNEADWEAMFALQQVVLECFCLTPQDRMLQAIAEMVEGCLSSETSDEFAEACQDLGFLLASCEVSDSMGDLFAQPLGLIEALHADAVLTEGPPAHPSHPHVL